ncbi:hypothetical protein [Erythrobacter sp.]|uniref:hypothetical protein n=1 Tax=Erythrobacter sp. TaxID=1042 RepID=UPI001425D6A6|nr:hypothetical protein [Erythrobacter sp.]QIQ85234.1 MAG: hypothetical protein G9473_05085 [Erythrobacter sp.]
MKFIKLESRGGNYLVVAENVAWLRTAENGQTSVGIIGGQPLLVVGTIEEVAQKILDGAGSDDAPAAPAQAHAPQAAAPEPQAAAAPEPEAPVAHEPDSEPVEANTAPQPAPAPSPAAPVAPKRVAAAPPRQMKKGKTLAERVAAAAAAAR